MVTFLLILPRLLSILVLPIEWLLVSQWYALTHTQRPSTIITSRNNNNITIEEIATNRVITKIGQLNRTRWLTKKQTYEACVCVCMLSQFWYTSSCFLLPLEYVYRVLELLFFCFFWQLMVFKKDICIRLSTSILSSMDITKRKRKEKSKHESKNTRSVKIMIGFEITVVYVCICMQREREAAMKRNVQCTLAWRWFASTTFSSLSSVNRRNKSCSSSLAINNTKIIIKQQQKTRSLCVDNTNQSTNLSL
jgi:hypothetical protein